ncbi:hypothetical protein BVC80_65g23 [Macleaya cordata]|uniref:RecA family profile 1 domain-containing protein n=1 Tax=Macleaya cordata TaxID=56857 RepID=A0A200QWX7_MACCD|nr:hypothetical protein BVC80_65g23 [Macleaya cordata]
MTPREWISGDESAKEMLARVLTERPFLLIPPLHRVPLRVGNVVEIVGPSPSAKTEILIQAAISSILPKEWKGVPYGGLERLVLYFDLDCRFDVERLSQSLRHHIVEANRSTNRTSSELNKDLRECDDMREPTNNFDEELFVGCMRRFLYVRCYNSYEFLATLKTLCYRLQKETEANGVAAHFLMIDSISAFYWADRASTPLPVGGDNRKSLSLHSVVETVVQEIRKLLQVQPMILLATKATILGDGELKRFSILSDEEISPSPSPAQPAIYYTQDTYTSSSYFVSFIISAISTTITTTHHRHHHLLMTNATANVIPTPPPPLLSPPPDDHDTTTIQNMMTSDNDDDDHDHRC